MKTRSLEEKLNAIPAIASLLVMAVAGPLLIVWLTQPQWKEFAADMMKANTCLGILAAALSLFCLKGIPRGSRFWPFTVGKALALFVFLLGLATAIQYFSSTNFGIDEIIASDFINTESSIHPGRMSPIAALSFAFLGLTLLFKDSQASRFRLLLTEFLLTPVLLISFLALVGYMYNVSALYKVGPYIRIAWPTALCLHVLALSLLLSKPRSGFIAEITSPEAGGAIARKLLPVILIFPVALGWLRLRGQLLGYFGLEQGLALFVMTMVVLLTIIVALSAKGLNEMGQERAGLLEREKLARREAELEREKIHSLFLQAPAIISVTSGPKHIFELFYIEARKTVSGRDVTGLSIRDALPELEGLGFFEALDSAYQSGTPILLKESPAELMQSDGSRVLHYFNVEYRPWRDLQGNVAGILNVTIDVTDEVLARRKAEKAVNARDEFLSIASHELKTPLTSLKMQLQMTKRGITKSSGQIPSTEKLLKVFCIADKQVDRLTELIEEMLDVSRIQSGKFQFNLQKIELRTVIQDVVDQFSEYLATTKNSISIHVDQDITGNWDRSRLEQVITNLLNNAALYAPGVHIDIAAKKIGTSAAVSITDQGPGISKSNQVNLFERFERAGISKNTSGLGLGLYISKEIIEKHGGKIHLESEEGKGASFIFELPMNLENPTQETLDS